MRNAHNNVRTPERRNFLEALQADGRVSVSVNRDCEEMRCTVTDWIDLLQDKVGRSALVRTIMRYRV
jgi:hypothetical protein